MAGIIHNNWMNVSNTQQNLLLVPYNQVITDTEPAEKGVGGGGGGLNVCGIVVWPTIVQLRHEITQTYIDHFLLYILLWEVFNVIIDFQLGCKRFSLFICFMSYTESYLNETSIL